MLHAVYLTCISPLDTWIHTKITPIKQLPCTVSKQRISRTAVCALLDYSCRQIDPSGAIYLVLCQLCCHSSAASMALAASAAASSVPSCHKGSLDSAYSRHRNICQGTAHYCTYNISAGGAGLSKFQNCHTILGSSSSNAN
jgi:hypothetical protein